MAIETRDRALREPEFPEPQSAAGTFKNVRPPGPTPTGTQAEIVSAPKLLYLGFAFPPGVAALFPGINPAGHGFETQMLAALRAHFEIRSVGVMPFAVPELPIKPNPASGIAHDLLLRDQVPELWYRLRSLARLKRQYRLWIAGGWRRH